MLLGSAIELVFLKVAEAIFSEGGLRVIWAPSEEPRVGLGARPIVIGGHTDCDLRPPQNDCPAVVGRVVLVHGSVEFIDGSTGMIHALRDGSGMEFGTMARS
jgi:hypothetical protein